MSRTDYDEKMRALVHNTEIYEEINRDPTSRFQLKNNDLVKSLYNKQKVDAYQKSKLVTYKAIAPRIYGLPKIYKPEVPLRPVVSYVGSPSYALAKFVASVLLPLTDSPYNVKNSQEVSQFVTGQSLPDGYIVVSLDVISLFTNVPIDLVLSEVEVRYHELEVHTNLEKTEILNLLDFCLRSGSFMYEGKFYLQKDGVAMGSPIGPIAADIAMQRTLNSVLEDSPLRIGFVRKYVDDLLVSVHRDDVEALVPLFNSFHPKIQFTLEREQDGVLPYLDLSIYRDETNVLSTVWYCKPSASQRMLNYNSAHPRSTIINVGKNLINRARSVTTKLGVNMDDTLRRILKKNDFPERVIRRMLRDGVPGSRGSSMEQTPQSERFFTLTYVKGISEKMRSRIVRSTGARIAFQPAKKLREFFTKVKDPIPKLQKSDVIYSVPCGGCGLNYIGTTGQQLQKRLQQHKRDIKPPIKNENATSLCAHVVETGHPFEFEETKILDSHKSYAKRMVLESLHIKQNLSNCVNKRSEISGIHNSYAGLLR
ncbi:uncharacterized protein LOC129801012 [Phlebotomus papatasi]|uniref:uncharacterized protein LOC129801012 n=1 Tax=Phlebotomus papatasi TaxID=29031 RepID=UPI0024833BCE|nr:uncharacterized protein LOC129801012 [Phlebotomus papatasi]